MEWISVKDRLPELDKTVIYSSENKDVGTIQFTIMNGYYCIKNTNEYPLLLDGSGITHWMPLPEPPKT